MSERQDFHIFSHKKSLKSLYFLPIVMEMFLPAGKIVISHSNIDGTTGSNDAQFKLTW